MGPPPPINPQSDAHLRARAERHHRRDVTGIVCVMLQPTLALGLGAWAALPLTGEVDDALPYAAVAMVLALAAAWVLILSLRFALATIFAVVTLPRLVRRLNAPPPPSNSNTARDDVIERLVDIGSVALHGLIFIAGALLIASVAAGASTLYGFVDFGWRFGLPAAALSLLTLPALRVVWFGES